METSKLKSQSWSEYIQYMYVHWKNSEAMIYSIHMLHIIYIERTQIFICMYCTYKVSLY